MKIGLSFTGISHGYGRDFTHCFPVIQGTVIKPLQKKHDIKTYVTTYSTNMDKLLLDSYKPAKYHFVDAIPNQTAHQVLTYLAGIELLKGEDLDFVISTRFDIHFHKKLSHISFDYSKFNTLFHEKGWRNSNFTTDNLYAFPYSMLDQLIECINDCYNNPARPGLTDLHHLWYRMSKKVPCHIVSPDVDELSNYNSFYSLCRNK